MDDNLISRSYYISRTPIVSSNSNAVKSSETSQSGSFRAVLEQELAKSSSDITFSKHALQRIDDRQIELSEEMLNSVSDAVTRADEKGVTDALILGGDTAFIVNVPTRTVITTMTGGDMDNHVITNIDGTVIL